jgi:hypothetical protein
MLPNKDRKTFEALEWLAAICSHILDRGEQMRYYGFWSTIRDYSSNGNSQSNFKMKVTAL